MATPATTRGQRTHAAVLAGARRRFASEGYDGTTLARIAADAGVSEPTVAFHFGSKSGLLVAVMHDYYDDLLAAIDEVVDVALAPVDRLRAFARWWVSHNADNLDLLSVFSRQGRRAGTDDVVLAFAECNRRVTRVFDRLVEDLGHVGMLTGGVPTRIVRDAFFGATEHVMLGRALTGRPADLDRAADDLVDLLLHGAAGVPIADGAPSLTSLDAKLDRVLERLE